VRSVRWRLTALLVLVLVIAVAAAVVATRQVLLARLDDRVDRSLTLEVEELRNLASGVDPATGEAFADVRSLLRLALQRDATDRFETQLAVVDGQVAARSSRPPLLRLDTDPDLLRRLLARPGELSDVDSPVGRLRVAAVPVRVGAADEQGVFVAVAFRDAEAAEVGDVIELLTIVGLAAAAGGGALVALLAGRMLRPVRLVRQGAERISENDLTQRIQVPPHGGDDVVEMARAVNLMLDRLEAGYAAQRQFVDDAGHELRTPLTVIRGNLEVAAHKDPEQRRTSDELVLDEVDRMARIVNDLLLLAKAERPDFITLEPVDAGRLLDEIEAKLVALADREWQMEARPEGPVLADRQRLTQAMLQLAANAVQHTSTGDAVWFGGALEGGTLRLWMRDSGPGFPEADRQRVFERFARADAHRPSDGAGLGLSIVKAIAVGHGGTAHVRTGSTVELILPVKGAS
jgi:two-component system, OmpR family, sensor kinase